MKVCYFGIYQKDYCRAKNTIIGLRKSGVEVLEVQDRTLGFKKFWNLYQMHKGVKRAYDMMIVGFPGQIIMPFAKLICRKPIVFDAFASMYDGNVFDRKNCRPLSLRAFWYYFLDWMSCVLSDKILLDTEEHVKYFVRTFHINPKKFLVVYHGCNDELFYPIKNIKKNEKFIIEFHGYITALHGVEYLIEAMDILREENVELWIIADLKRPDCIKKIKMAKDLGLENVKFFEALAPAELIKKIALADVGIGIFGNTDKVERVIPNKVFELMASQKAVITADTPAIREKFTHKENIYLCKRADPNSIAQAILEIKNNAELREHISQNAFTYMKENLTPKNLGAALKKELEEIIM